jgi:hypothetical protein
MIFCGGRVGPRRAALILAQTFRELGVTQYVVVITQYVVVIGDYRYNLMASRLGAGIPFRCSNAHIMLPAPLLMFVAVPMPGG